MEEKQKSELWSYVKLIAVTVALTICIRSFLFSPIAVSGASMKPTIEDGDRVVINKIVPRLFGYERFDIVVLQAPNEELLIKRIVGIPGDVVEFRDDVLYINDEKIEEPFLQKWKKEIVEGQMITGDFTLQELLGKREVPSDQYFVLGDNRRISRDSRDATIGFINEKEILGTVNVVIWPFSRISIVKDE